ncbi:MAG: autotransporter outer membrane beta-barrel domain-containing protein [Elusimicrobiaceae bacterium]|nr:autotransporter outer membrane beta-barrel domain-containing protein [Elusimicrobiaceae bacterium]MBQ6223988.1 autotransporter outer membrane beta-barrel domain-containing protein [Campylobacter sp.]
MKTKIATFIAAILLTQTLLPSYVFADQASYKDGFGQKISSSKDQTLTAVLGAKVGQNFKTGSILLKPEFKLAAVCDLMQDGDNLNVSTGLNSYSVKTEQLEKFGIETGLKVLTALTDNVELSVSYDGQFRSDYYNHTASFSVKYCF